jgi:hypothetical protein
MDRNLRDQLKEDVMQTIAKTFRVISTCGLLLALAATAAVRAPDTVFANQASGNLQVAPQPDSTDASSKGLNGVVMISVLKDGAVVKQGEVAVSGLPPNFTLPAGVYDVRVEGEGIATMIKRGVHVTPNDSTKVIAPMRRGQGARVVEYATGGLAREEVAARLAKLEAAVAQLQKSQAK